MQELININDENGIKTVNARDLWEVLDSKRQFGNWIQDRLDGFIEDKDFIINKYVKVQIEGKREVNRPVIEYHLTLDTAKHLCMLERNKQGRQIRQYFIDVENRSRQVLSGPALIAAALIEAQKTLDELKPKAQLADRVLNTTNLRTITDLGKMVSRPRKIFTDLLASGVLFRRDGVLFPYQKYIDDGLFVVKYNLVKIGDHEERKPQTYVTAKGERWIIDTLYPPKLPL